MLFLLTRPLRDVTYFRLNCIASILFLLTRPLRDVTNSARAATLISSISTHTPLAGRDLVTVEDDELNINFYSHAPCGT